MEYKGLNKLLSSLLALVAIQLQVEAQALPRLVVCITVDQLRGDYLSSLEPMMGQEGFKRILSSGQISRSVDFPLYQPYSASATASIFTGTYPAVHGIEQVENYHLNSGKRETLFTDNSYQGIYTRDNFSPKNLLVHTLGDRLKEASGGSALVYSIAPTAEEAIASGGSLADGAYWIDAHIGAWATSSYYSPMPPQIDQYNRSSEGPNKRLIQGLQWKPLKAYNKPSISYSDWSQPFSYRYSNKNISQYRESALVNEEVTTLAIKLLECAGYAERKSPGLLALSYTVKPQVAGELTATDVDTYLRLDEEITRLLTALERQIGLKNCLISLSGTGYTSYRTDTSGRKEKAKRSLNIGRITSLTNMYLTALYGQGEWIKSNSNGRLYLNHKAIESRKLDLPNFREHVASFLASSEGLEYAVSIDEIRRATDERYRSIARSIYKRYEADVYWQPLSSWSIEDAKDNPLLETGATSIPSPFVLMGGAFLAEGKLPEVREVRDIVRIICSVLRIRPPTS